MSDWSKCYIFFNAFVSLISLHNSEHLTLASHHSECFSLVATTIGTNAAPYVAMLAMQRQIEANTQNRPIRQKEDSETLCAVITGALSGPLHHVITRNTFQTHQTATAPRGHKSLFQSVFTLEVKIPFTFITEKIYIFLTITFKTLKTDLPWALRCYAKKLL